MTKNNLLVLLVFILLFSCSKKKDKEILKVLHEHKLERIKFLKNDIKYSALVDYGMIDDFSRVEFVLDSCFNLPENKKDVKLMNSIIQKIEQMYSVDLIKISNPDLYNLVTLNNEILLLDWFISESNRLGKNTIKLKPYVNLISENNNEANFDIGLKIIDSIYNPEIDLLIDRDTFPVLVEDNWKCRIKIRKLNGKLRSRINGRINYLNKEYDFELSPASPSIK